MMRLRKWQSEENGEFYYRFEGANGEPRGTSEGYPTKFNRDRAVLDFFEDLGRDGKIVEGVIAFDLDIIEEPPPNG